MNWSLLMWVLNKRRNWCVDGKVLWMAPMAKRGAMEVISIHPPLSTFTCMNVTNSLYVFLFPFSLQLVTDSLLVNLFVVFLSELRCGIWIHKERVLFFFCRWESSVCLLVPLFRFITIPEWLFWASFFMVHYLWGHMIGWIYLGQMIHLKVINICFNLL